MLGFKRFGQLVAAFIGLQMISWACASASMAAHLTTLHNFGARPDGQGPSGLVRGANGVLYGITAGGGAEGYGAAFSLMPPEPEKNRWKERTLYSFTNGKDGRDPFGDLVRSGDGSLYGRSFEGGTSGWGTIFKLTPPEPGRTKWREKVVADFAPTGNLLLGPDGILYGLLANEIFSLTPPAPGATEWSLRVVYTFSSALGKSPDGGLIMDQSGNLYGTTDGGSDTDLGTVFRLVPPVQGNTSWSKQVLYRFKGTPDGARPGGRLAISKDGTLFGFTSFGGEGRDGTAFSIAPPAPGKTRWKERTLYSLGYPVSAQPENIVLGEAGVLYGTTCRGGLGNAGTVFSLTPPAPGTSNWTETMLHSFTLREGACPTSLTIDTDGVLYGTTSEGGAFYFGTVFKLVP